MTHHLMAALLGVVFTAEVHAQLVVTSAADSGPGSLRQAIADATSGDTITFTNTLSGQTLLMTNGAFYLNKTLTIDASSLANGIEIDGRGLMRVFEFASSTTNIIAGLMLRHGYSTFDGGAIYLSGANLTITNCILSDSFAQRNGGAIFCQGGIISIQDSVLTGDSAQESGGGIACLGGTITLLNSVLSGNSAANGGGIFNNSAGVATIVNSTLTNNSTANALSAGISADGGGIYNDGGTLTLQDSTLVDNYGGDGAFGDGPGGNGGGIFNAGGILTLQNTTLAHNYGGDGGDGIAGGQGGQGGGIYNEGGTLTLHNSTLVDNRGGAGGDDIGFGGNDGNGGDGGGIYNADGTATLLHATLANNQAGNEGSGNPGIGGGIYNSLSASVSLTNTIVAGNFRQGAIADNISGNTNSVSISASLTAGNPLLAPLGNYGGPTQTMPPQPGSPAINAGDNFITNFLISDQRGYARLVGNHVDIGAVEFGPLPGIDLTKVTSADDDLHGVNFELVTLRDAVVLATNGSVVTFDSTVSGQTILITNGQLVVDRDLTIDGSSLPAGITLDGNDNGRILLLPAGSSPFAVTLDSLTFTRGSVGGSAGGAIRTQTNTTLIVRRCTFYDNHADAGSGDGGAISSEGHLRVENSTFTQNSSIDRGGAVRAVSGTAAFLNVTITGNDAFQGGGIYNDAATLNLTNTILAGNSAVSSGPNVFGGINGAASNLTSGIPLLAPLGDYGGPTPTMPPLADSPAIDSGVASALTTDQRGYPRFSGSAVDVGAVEFQWAPLVTPPLLVNVAWSEPDDTFQFAFTNAPNADFTVLTATNLPSAPWIILGPAIQTAPGQYEFHDPDATNHAQRYYRVVSP